MNLPASPEAEKALIGSILMRPAAVVACLALVGSEDFFVPAHAETWTSVTNLSMRRREIDVVTVSDELKERGRLGLLEGGMNYLVMASQNALSWNAEVYARLVRDKAALRRIIAASSEIASSAAGDHGNIDDFFREAVGKISRVALRDVMTEEASTTEIFEAVTRSREASQKGEVTSRIPTGIPKLDDILNGGLPLGVTTAIISQTSIGKSSFLRQIIARGAEERGVSGLIFSLEDTREDAFVGMACNLSRLPSRTFAHRTPKNAGSDEESRARWKAIHQAGSRLAGLGEKVRISQYRNIGAICAAATVWRSTHPGPAIIGVDHIQKVIGIRGKGITREQEVSGVSQALTDLAKDLKLAIVVPGQLNDNARFEKRAPKLGDTRESKGIEHDARVVLGIHRDRSKQEGQASIDILKHTGGELGRVWTTWHGAWQGFEVQTTSEEMDTEADAD